MYGAEQHGRDGRGKDGLLGYCSYLAATFPKQYTYLLGKLLPLTVRDGIVSVPMTINVSSVPTGNVLTFEQMEKLSGRITIDGRAERVPDDEQDGSPLPKRGPLPN